MSRLALRAAQVVVAALLLPCGFRAEAEAYELQIAPSGVPVRWFEDELIFTLDLDDRIPGVRRGEAEEAAQNALATWSAAGGPLLIGIADDNHGDDDGQDRDRDDSKIIRLASDREDPDIDAESLARTRLSFDPQSGRAQRVAITVNVFDYRWSTGDPCEGAYDLEATLAHEIGHALGFRHSAEPEATMFTQPRPCERDRRDLAPDDLAGVAALYGSFAPSSAEQDTLPAGCAAGGASGPGAAVSLFFAALLSALRRGGRRSRS